MINFSDVEISKKIVSISKELLILTESNNEYLKLLIIDNQKVIDSYNLQNMLVIDITPTEKGCFNSTVKKVAQGYFKTWNINLNIDTDNSLLYSYTIFMRRVKSKKTYKRTSLELATTNIFKTEIINQLIKLNQ